MSVFCFIAAMFFAYGGVVDLERERQIGGFAALAFAVICLVVSVFTWWHQGDSSRDHTSDISEGKP